MERLLKKTWLPVAALLVGVVSWEIAARLLQTPFLPSFWLVLRAWWNIYQSGVLVAELIVSLQTLFKGYLLAVVLGLTMGIVMGRYRRVEYYFEPLIDINLATPTLLFIPFLFAIFDIGDEIRIAIVFMYAVFIIIVNTVAGIRTADRELTEMAKSFGATERQVFFKIVIYSAMPMMMAGLRIGVSRAVKGMINGELFIALVGLGARLRTYGGSFQIDKTLAILLTIIFVALTATSLVQYFSRLISKRLNADGY